LRPDLGSFEVGAFYKHNRSGGEWVEYIGIATMAELNGEQVGIFRFPEPGGGGACVIATQRTYDEGERFTPAGEALANDVAEE
jgi:hypothetical protein